MSDDNANATPQRDADPQAPQADNQEAEASAEAPQQDIGADAEALRAEVADLKDKLLRTLAEMENLRRRTEKEIRDARDYAVTAFARDLLNVCDNFERAHAAEPKELPDDSPMKAFIDGVEMTGKELLATLTKHGVKKLEPQGERFDPNLHQAMFEVANPDVTAGTVVQVMQAGFTIGGRVLRPALVGVAKGGPKHEPKAEETEEAPAGPTIAHDHSIDKTV